MDYHPPEPDPRRAPAPLLDYAGPKKIVPDSTSRLTRIVTLAMSLGAMLLGVAVGVPTLLGLYDRVLELQWEPLPDERLRLLVVSAVLLAAGLWGIVYAMHFARRRF